MPDTFVGPRPTMHTPPHLFGTVKSIDRVLEEETKHQIFGLMCRGDRLWSFAES